MRQLRWLLVAGAAVLGCTSGVGAPQEAAAPLTRAVYPLEQQEGVWWVGIADICDLVGATMEGAEAVRPLEAPGGYRVVVGIPGAAGYGPLRVVVGEDTYEFKLGGVALERNGEAAWDFVHAPKRIRGIPSASLVDMAHMLGLAQAGQLDGQPTLFRGYRRYRLVDGRPVTRLSYLHIQAPDGTLLWKYHGRPLEVRDLLRRLGVGKYIKHNDSLYLRARTGLNRLGKPSSVSGAETLYGPVVPGTYRSEGVTGDQLGLTILRLSQQQRGGGVPGPGGRYYWRPEGKAPTPKE